MQLRTVDKLKAILVDDEEAARNVLGQLLKRNCPSIEIVATCEDVPSAVEEIKRFQPDVVFLDVQMPNYAGYEIVDFFNEIDFEIIFVTAYDQYAIKAFELSAVDYLVKPINRQRLIEAVSKLDQKINEKKAILDYQILKESIQNKKVDKIVISELGNKRVLQLDDIIAIEAKGAYSMIHLKDQKELLVSKNLKHFESTLPENQNFFRSHKSWIINTKHILAFRKNKGEIELTDNVQAKLSKYKVDQFRQLSPVF